MNTEAETSRRGPLILAAVVLGVGLGGFADGIVLHQIFQWHHMLSSVVIPDDIVSLKINMFWDGLFHALTWTVTAAGVGLLWRAGRIGHGARSGRSLLGGLLMGWGLFNLVEGLMDHQLLAVHHVRPGDAQAAWDIAFLASGLVLIGVGWMLARRLSGDVPLRPPRHFPTAARTPA